VPVLQPFTPFSNNYTNYGNDSSTTKACLKYENYANGCLSPLKNGAGNQVPVSMLLD